MNANRFPLNFMSNKILACLFTGRSSERAMNWVFRGESEAVRDNLESLREAGLIRRIFPDGKDGNLEAAEYEILAEGREYCRKYDLEFPG